MFEVKECKDAAHCASLAQKFGLSFSEKDRAFVLFEGGERGMSVIGLDGANVVIKGVHSEIVEYSDVLWRATLGVIRDFNSISVKFYGNSEYLKQFGFIYKDCYMEIVNKDIKLKCS